MRATNRVTSSSLVENDMASNSRLVASAFCKASASLPERTRAALNSFAKAGLSVRFPDGVTRLKGWCRDRPGQALMVTCLI